MYLCIQCILFLGTGLLHKTMNISTLMSHSAFAVTWTGAALFSYVLPQKHDWNRYGNTHDTCHLWGEEGTLEMSKMNFEYISIQIHYNALQCQGSHFFYPVKFPDFSLTFP